MIDKIGNLTLTLFTSDGEKIGTINAEEVKIDIENNEDIIKKNNKSDFNPFEKCSFECETKLNLFTYYYLMYGIKMTNNYLKMHGGIMRRKRWLK